MGTYCPWIFTASVAAHAERCLECLGVGDVETLRGKPIIDVRAVGYLTKYEEGAYRAAERIAGEHDPLASVASSHHAPYMYGAVLQARRTRAAACWWTTPGPT